MLANIHKTISTTSFKAYIKAKIIKEITMKMVDKLQSAISTFEK